MNIDIKKVKIFVTIPIESTNKVREAASVVAEDPEPLPADEDSEFDKLVQAAIKRAEEADNTASE